LLIAHLLAQFAPFEAVGDFTSGEAGALVTERKAVHLAGAGEVCPNLNARGFYPLGEFHGGRIALGGNVQDAPECLPWRLLAGTICFVQFAPG